MYACYIDESGHCGKKYNSNQPVEVLAGVITDLSKLFKTQREQRGLLKLLNDNGVKIKEIKASDTYGGRKQWSEIPHEIRGKVIEYILGWAEQRKCKFIISPIDSQKFFDLKKSGDTIAKLMQYPYESGAMNILFAIERNNRKAKNNKGKTFIIFDEQVGHDENIIQMFDGDLSFSDTYTGFKPKPRAKEQPERLGEIVDIPFFSKSHLSIIIQIADVVAYVVNRYLQLKTFGDTEKYEGEIDKISLWFDKIGHCTIKYTHINPPDKDLLCDFYRAIRPDGWSAKNWIIKELKN